LLRTKHPAKYRIRTVVDKYDAIKHGHTANPRAQEQKKAEDEASKEGGVGKSDVSVEYM